MQIEDYKSNSHKSIEKRVQQPIVTNAKVRKKSEVRRIAEVFIPEDVEKVKSHILMDVLVPAAKKAIYDTITNGIEMILYGESGGGNRKSSTASKISYRSFYENVRGSRHSEPQARFNTVTDFEDIAVEKRGEAESILERMDELVSKYGMASVADMYDLIGVTAPYTANNYGWTDIRGARVVRIRDGYVIKMPRVRPLE